MSNASYQGVCRKCNEFPAETGQGLCSRCEFNEKWCRCGQPKLVMHEMCPTCYRFAAPSGDSWAVEEAAEAQATRPRIQLVDSVTAAVERKHFGTGNELDEPLARDLWRQNRR